MEHADIGAAKTLRDRALSIVRGDSAEQEPRGSKRPKQRKETSYSRPMGKRAEPGNLSNQDIKAAMS